MGYDTLRSVPSGSKNGYKLYPDFRKSVMDPKSVASSNYATGSVNKIVRVGIGDRGRGR